MKVVPLCTRQNPKLKTYILFYFIALISFLFSLTHSSLYTLLTLYPVITIPCQFTLSSNPDNPFKLQKKLFQLFRKHSTLKKEGSLFLRNSYLSAQECARRHMPEDCSCSRHSAACLTTLSLHNWNCVDGESLTSTEVVLFSDIMVGLLAEV